jgi:hypothetical protein
MTISVVCRVRRRSDVYTAWMGRGWVQRDWEDGPMVSFDRHKLAAALQIRSDHHHCMTLQSCTSPAVLPATRACDVEVKTIQLYIDCTDPRPHTRRSKLKRMGID